MALILVFFFLLYLKRLIDLISAVNLRRRAQRDGGSFKRRIYWIPEEVNIKKYS